jgi:cytochrome c-type biogenesis protein CcmE
MSKKLDEELANAISAGDPGDAPAIAAPAASRPAAQPSRSRSLGLLATLLVLVGAIVALFTLMKPAAIYSVPVDQILGAKDKYVGRQIRVEGELVPGTLVKQDNPCEYRFTIHSAQTELPVRYPQCVVPDTFRDVPGGGVQVKVEGKLTREGSFQATLVMAQCSSKYNPDTHEMTGDKKPQGPLSSN